MSAVDCCHDVDTLRGFLDDALGLAERIGGDCADPFLTASAPSSCFDGSDLTPNQRIRECTRRITELLGGLRMSINVPGYVAHTSEPMAREVIAAKLSPDEEGELCRRVGQAVIYGQAATVEMVQENIAYIKALAALETQEAT